MRYQKIRQMTYMLVVVFFIVGLCLDDVNAQRRRRQSRRVTNPVNTTPQPTPTPRPATTTTADPKIISTADETVSDTTSGTSTNGRTGTRSSRNTPAAPLTEEERLRRTLDKLSSDIDKLTNKMSQMEQQQRTMLYEDLLSRTEQRAENLNAQLRDVQTKEAELQARLSQVEFESRPENLERSTATYGSTRPEELREQRRRFLEAEKLRLQSQLDQLATSRRRLESAIAAADAQAERIRARMTDAASATSPTPVEANTTDTNTTIPPVETTTPPGSTPFLNYL
jgi:prefoldin subunit 5